MDEVPEASGRPDPAAESSPSEAPGGIVVRDLGPGDCDAVRLLHEQLSDSDAHLRFCGPRPNRLDTLAAMICRQDFEHYALGAFDDGALIGVANYVIVDTGRGHSTAEFALVVDENEQRHGIGTVLLMCLSAAAFERGVDHLTAEILAENTLMLAVIAELGWSHALRLDGTVAHFDLDLQRHEVNSSPFPPPRLRPNEEREG